MAASYHAIKIDLPGPGKPKTPFEIQPRTPQDCQPDFSVQRNINGALYILYAPGSFSKEVMMRACPAEVHGTVTLPIQAVIDKFEGPITFRVIARYKK